MFYDPVNIKFKDCKKAIEFFFACRLDGFPTSSISESFERSLIDASNGIPTSRSTNPDAIVGLDDIINAYIDIEKIIKKFSKSSQKAFLLYVTKGVERAALAAARKSTRMIGLQFKSKEAYFYGELQRLGDYLKKENYLYKSYRAEQFIIDEINRLNEKIFSQLEKAA